MSVFISLRALNTTELALKVGQGAYLGVSDAKVTLSLKDDPLPNIYAITLKGILHNTGNTPARIGLVKVSIVYPERLRGWQELAYRYNGPIFVSKGDAAISIVQWFQLTDAAVKELNSRPSTSFGALFRVNYTDVFDDKHTMSWEEEFKYPGE